MIGYLKNASVPGVLVLGHKTQNVGHCRLGLVIPKKILKRAVWRNRVKRVARETFRLSKQSLPCVDFLVIAKPGIKDISNAELTRSLLSLWDQISRRLPASCSYVSTKRLSAPCWDITADFIQHARNTRSKPSKNGDFFAVFGWV